MNKKEPLSNMGLVCADCAPKPNPKYLQWPLKEFVGRFVKKGFKEKKLGKSVEHLWVLITGIENDHTLKGEIANDPILDVGLIEGDEVFVGTNEIEKVSVA